MSRRIATLLSFALLLAACSSDDRGGDGKVVIRPPIERDAGSDAADPDATDPDAAEEEDVSQCEPESDESLCARSGYLCGTLEAEDNCGTLRTVDSCGTCEDGEACSEGVCACVPETDEDFCLRASADCGELTAEDNCGVERTVAECGVCTEPDICGGDGVANVCSCEPESDAEMCARLGFECGALDSVDNCGAQRNVASCGEEVDVCTGEDTCGGGSAPGVCGCTPMTCEDLGVLCGQAQDGCGNTIDCDEFCVQEIAAGQNHNCAIGSGKLKCWGRGNDGALGTGNSTTQRNPTDVVGLTDVAHVAAGAANTCAITTSGALVCWGRNTRGQLGIGNTVDSNSPGVATIAANVKDVAVGQEHACALLHSGEVKCWGSNQYGQIGDDSYAIDSNVGIPTTPVGLDSLVTHIAAGPHHTCVIQDGAVKCWGRNHYAQSGRYPGAVRIAPNFWGWYNANTWEPDTWIRTPRLVTPPQGSPPFTGVKAIAAGNRHTCLISGSDELWCWGSMPGLPRTECAYQGSLQPQTDCASFPTSGVAIGLVRDNSDDIPEVSNVRSMWIAEVPTQVSTNGKTPVALGAGGDHLCLYVSDPDQGESNVYCFGNGAVGQIGDGTTNHWPAPRRVIADTNNDPVVALGVAAGGQHSCALVEGNNIRCWGSNADGQIGNSALQRDESYRAYPVLLE